MVTTTIQTMQTFLKLKISEIIEAVVVVVVVVVVKSNSKIAIINVKLLLKLILDLLFNKKRKSIIR
jgi:hypothetical protein